MINAYLFLILLYASIVIFYIITRYVFCVDSQEIRNQLVSLCVVFVATFLSIHLTFSIQNNLEFNNNLKIVSSLCKMSKLKVDKSLLHIDALVTVNKSSTDSSTESFTDIAHGYSDLDILINDRNTIICNQNFSYLLFKYDLYMDILSFEYNIYYAQKNTKIINTLEKMKMVIKEISGMLDDISATIDNRNIEAIDAACSNYLKRLAAIQLKNLAKDASSQK